MRRPTNPLQGRVGQSINGGLTGWPNARVWILGHAFLPRVGLGVVKPRDSHMRGAMWRQEPEGLTDLGKRSSSWAIRDARSFRQ